MTKDQIRKWLRRVPFVPFEITLENGDRYAVRHPETVAIGDGEMVIYTPQKEVVWFKVRKVTSLKRFGGGRRG